MPAISGGSSRSTSNDHYEGIHGLFLQVDEIPRPVGVSRTPREDAGKNLAHGALGADICGGASANLEEAGGHNKTPLFNLLPLLDIEMVDPAALYTYGVTRL